MKVKQLIWLGGSGYSKASFDSKEKGIKHEFMIVPMHYNGERIMYEIRLDGHLLLLDNGQQLCRCYELEKAKSACQAYYEAFVQNQLEDKIVNTQDIVYRAVQMELERAINKNGHFHSPHEAYAVLLEEIEELRDLSAIGYREPSVVSRLDCNIRQLWQHVKHNADGATTIEDLNRIQSDAMRFAEEAIQVLAMCDKYKMFLEQEPKLC